MCRPSPYTPQVVGFFTEKLRDFWGDLRLALWHFVGWVLGFRMKMALFVLIAAETGV